MTQISDDMLMAYADGELDEPQRSEVQRAIAADAAMAERARRHAATRARLQAAFAPVLDEPMPARLLDAAQPKPPGAVVDLADARAAREVRRTWTWSHWGGMAASVLIGVLIGKLVPSGGGADPFATQAGSLVARGAVARALSTQLASAPTTADGVSVQLTFVDQSGAYCRTFKTATLAGLACRSGADWRVHAVTQDEPATPGAMRQAASALPRSILEAVDQRIAGDALDANAEREAQQRSWRR